MNFMTPSPDVEILQEMLRKTDVRSILSYKEMSDTLGHKVRSTSSALRTALKRCEKDGLIFDAVASVGYQRVSDNGAIDKSLKVTSSVRRKARRGMRIIDSTEGSNELSANNKVLASVNRFRLFMVDQVTGKSVTSTLKSNMAGTTVSSKDAISAVNAMIENMMAKKDASRG